LLAALALLAVGADVDAARWLVTGAARSHPGGAFIGAEALLPIAEQWSLGGFLSYDYYWAEMGSKLEWRYLGGFLIGGVWLGVEPGDYLPARAATDARKPGLRGLLRARLEFNLKLERVWLYNRATVEGRVRTFEEHDPYRDAILGTELSFEEALAPLVKLFGWGPSTGLWVYAEITVAAEPSFGLLDARPSAGVILENLAPGLTVDVDVYRSLREGPIHGNGVLVFVWWRPD
jgi:hypothetical protein